MADSEDEPIEVGRTTDHSFRAVVLDDEEDDYPDAHASTGRGLGEEEEFEEEFEEGSAGEQGEVEVVNEDNPEDDNDSAFDELFEDEEDGNVAAAQVGQNQMVSRQPEFLGDQNTGEDGQDFGPVQSSGDELEELEDEVEGFGRSDEAEELDPEYEKMFKPRPHRRRGHRMSDAEIKSTVQRLLDRMDKAADDDWEMLGEGEPALNKLKMLEEVEAAVLRRDLQTALLDGGVLGSLKAWLEPFTNGTLPNEKIRTSVLKILQKLPIDTADHFRRDQLKRSQIGSRVMFYAQVKEESVQNRRIARELVERWSRPISLEAHNEEEDEQRRMEQLQIRKRCLDTEREEEERTRLRRLNSGGAPGLRFTARIPERNRMDYVIQPESKVSGEMKRPLPKKESSVVKRLQRIQRRKVGKDLQAMKPSIEGRGIL